MRVLKNVFKDTDELFDLLLDDIGIMAVIRTLSSVCKARSVKKGGLNKLRWRKRHKQIEEMLKIIRKDRLYE